MDNINDIIGFLELCAFSKTLDTQFDARTHQEQIKFFSTTKTMGHTINERIRGRVAAIRTLYFEVSMLNERFPILEKDEAFETHIVMHIMETYKRS